MEDEFGRVRGYRLRKLKKRRQPPPNLEFQNPFPYMSSVEARIYLMLSGMNIPFSWRAFNGSAELFQELLPGFTPEFTLPDYKAVILVLGTYYGTLPGVLDKNALAKAALEADGWRCALLWEADVVRDVRGAVFAELPDLQHPTITGPEYPNIYGVQPNYIANRRQRLLGINMKRTKFIDPERKDKSHDPGHRRPRPIRDRRTRAYEPDRRKNLGPRHH